MKLSLESISVESLQQIPLSYATCSIGSPTDPASHTLEAKITAIANAGFQEIELSMPDLLAFASSHLKKDVLPTDYSSLCVAAAAVKSICSSKDLKILVLQPFSNYEGWPDESPERKDALDRAKGWMKIMDASGCLMLQVGSTDTPLSKLQPGEDHKIVSETLRKRIVKHLQELADLLSVNGYQLAYENWCWSSHAPTWKDAWSIIQQVDRPNAGLCLDTFQIAGSEWADPTTISGLVESLPVPELNERFGSSLEELRASVPPEKIFFFQISDAYKPQPHPLGSEVKDGLAPRGVWSHSYRPLPCTDGYLPVVEVVKAVLGTGFRGSFSYEVFDGGPDGKSVETNIESYAKAAREKHDKLMKSCLGEERML